MSDSYKYSYHSGPFYRKFMVCDNVWCEVNRAKDGVGLWFHIGNSFGNHHEPSPKPIYFQSEDQFMEFCTKLLGVDHDKFETFWMRWGV